MNIVVINVIKIMERYFILRCVIRKFFVYLIGFFFELKDVVFEMIFLVFFVLIKFRCVVRYLNLFINIYSFIIVLLYRFLFFLCKIDSFIFFEIYY